MNFIPIRREVVGDEQVVIAVSVGIEKSRTDAVFRVSYTGRLGDVAERAVAVVAIEDVGAVVGHVHVGKAVGVDVADAAAVTVKRDRHPGGLGDVVEGAVTVIAIEHVRVGLDLPGGG